MNNQCNRVMTYIRENGSIDPWRAFTDIGVTRLAARIHEIRNENVFIERELVKSVNRYGENVTYAQYTLGQANAS